MMEKDSEGVGDGGVAVRSILYGLLAVLYG